MNGKLALAEALRREADPERDRRGHDAGAVRQLRHSRLGSPGRVLHRRARQAHRQGDLAGDAREADTWSTPIVVEHDGRAQVVTNGWASIHSYDLETGQGRLAHDRPDAAADSVARWRGMGWSSPRAAFNGSSLKAVRLAEASGDITGTKRDRVDARSRYAVRPVPAPVRRRAVHPEEQQRPPVGLRREDRHAALPGPAARRCPQRLLPLRSAPMAACTSPARTARLS